MAKSLQYPPMRNFLLTAVFLLTSLAMISAQRVRINGIVNDTESGEPLIGATVIVVGDNARGAVTDPNGAFTVQAAPGETLQFRYTGYETKEVVVGRETTLNISMSGASSVLNEIVVVGYGRQKKSDLTGAVASVKAEDLVQVQTPDVLQALQGRVAGVDVASQGGEPGAGVRIRIRGVGTINNSNPLYVVDGFQTFDLSFLNPNDIESMEVLKDASATAIYGSRGANGVVLITTKKGKAGKTRFEFDSYMGSQQAWRTLDVLTAAEYATLRFEAFANDGIQLDQEGDLYNRLKFVQDGNYRGTNWQDEVLRQGLVHNYTLSVSGGNEKSRYNITGTYYNEEGIVKNNNMEKFFLRLNNDWQLNRWLAAGVSASYVNTDRTFYNNDLFSGILPVALRTDPIAPAWDKDTDNWGRADLSYNNNPARGVDEIKGNRGSENKLVTNLFAEARITKDLSFRSQFGIDLKNIANRAYFPEFFITTDEARDQSTLTERRGQQTAWMWTNYATWNRQFGSHNLGLMAGVESQLGRYRDNQITAFNVPADESLQFLGAAKEVDYQVTSNQSDETLQSFFGRINYSLKDRYLLTVNLRYDGSSRFLGDNRWGFFPSFSAGWNLGREDFMRNVSFISDLKIRAGWGAVGNQNSAPNYGFVTTVSPDQLYVFNNQIVQGLIPTRLSNPELKWETTSMTNFGVDAFLWDDRIQITADYFVKTTSDMIVDVPIPGYVGADAPRVNAGDMENRGLEISTLYRNQTAGDLRYEIGFNFTKITNEVVSLGGGRPIESGFIGKLGNTTRTEEGYEIAYFYGLQTDGIFNTQAELDAHANSQGNPIQPNAALGDVKYVDANGDGLIDDNDRVYLGSGTPDFLYGITGGLSFKGFDLRLFFQGVQGNEVMNGLTRFLEASNGQENSLRTRLDRWTPDNPNSNEPRMTNTDLNRNTDRFSDRYVEDGSYLRLKNITLGYTLPSSFTGNRIGRLRLYVAADNLWTRTNYSGLDPEIGELYFNPLFYGVDQATYPQPIRLRFGVNMAF